MSERTASPSSDVSAGQTKAMRSGKQRDDGQGPNAASAATEQSSGEDDGQEQDPTAEILDAVGRIEGIVKALKRRVGVLQDDVAEMKQNLWEVNQGDSQDRETKRQKRARNRESGGSAVREEEVVEGDDLDSLMGRDYTRFVDLLYPVVLAQHGYDARGQRLDDFKLRSSCEVVAPVVFGEDRGKVVMEGLFGGRTHTLAHQQFVKKFSIRMTGTFKV